MPGRECAAFLAHLYDVQLGADGQRQLRFGVSHDRPRACETQEGEILG
jgi:hypothetical protein